MIAVEVFEHLAAVDAVLGEARRVLRPGGILAIVDKNAGSLKRGRPWLPNLVVKWLDETPRPLDVPARRPGPRALVLARGVPQPAAAAIRGRPGRAPAHRPAEAGRWLFRHVAAVRLMTLWSARVPGGQFA